MKILLSVFAVAVMLVLTASEVTARQPSQICDESGCYTLDHGGNYGSWDAYRRPSYRNDPWLQPYRPSYNYKNGYRSSIYRGIPYSDYRYRNYGYRSYDDRRYDYGRSSCRPYYYRY